MKLTPLDRNNLRMTIKLRLNPQFRITSLSKGRSHAERENVLGGSLKKKSVQESKPHARIIRSPRLNGSSHTEGSKQVKVSVNVRTDLYEGVKTEDNCESFRNLLSSRTIAYDKLTTEALKCLKNSDQPGHKTRTGLLGRAKEQNQEGLSSSKKVLKLKCRVNQFVFDRSKKSKHDTIAEQFWRNVNESLILPSQTEECSTDFLNFVEHFPTSNS